MRNDRTRDLIPRHVLEPSELFHFRGSTQIHEKKSHYLNFEQFLQLDCTETTFGQEWLKILGKTFSMPNFSFPFNV